MIDAGFFRWTNETAKIEYDTIVHWIALEREKLEDQLTNRGGTSRLLPPQEFNRLKFEFEEKIEPKLKRCAELRSLFTTQFVVCLNSQKT